MYKISDLRLNPKNPRTATDAVILKLSESIKHDPQFMELRPIVTDDDGTILGGNQRFKAIRDVLSMTEVPDTWVRKASDLTEEQKKRFVLVDNSPEGMSGSWDSEMLQLDYDLPELEALGFDLESMGLELSGDEGGLTDPDDVPEEPEEGEEEEAPDPVGQRLEIVFWPTPNAAFTLAYRYEAFSGKLTDENPYQLPMRIYPAVHYTMGGTWVDYNLMTTVP
jgi:hypothetical protein